MQIRNVEILKKRFGDASLQVCEVMLKDMADSKRIDANVHASAVSVSGACSYPRAHCFR